MQIILTREEYEQLRPNSLTAQFVESVRRVMDSHNQSGDHTRTLADIKQTLQEFDKALEQANHDDKFRLWPATRD